MSLFKIVLLLYLIVLFGGCAKTQEERELKVSDKNITIRLEAAVYPIEKQDILAAAGGYVEEIFVKNGDKVKKGNIIYSLDKELIKLDINNIKMEIATLEQIRDNAVKRSSVDGSVPAINLAALELKKVAYLKSKGYINSFEENTYKKNYINALFSNKTSEGTSFEKIKNLNKEIATKKTELQKLQHQLKHADVYAQISGFITGLKLNKGEQIGSGRKVGTIINLDKVIVKAGFATGLLSFIHVGQLAKVEFVTVPPLRVKAKITKITPIVDPTFDRMTLEIVVPNRNYILQEGTRALVSIIPSKKDQEIIKKYFIHNKTQTVLEIKNKI